MDSHEPEHISAPGSITVGDITGSIGVAVGPGARSDVRISYDYAPPKSVDEPTLEAARQKLAELPLDEVPAPASWPPRSRMYLRHNPYFVGREEKLKELAKILKNNNTSPEGQVTSAVITGMGGVGKSQLASEFVHRYGQYFSGGVFWLRFANEEAIPAEVAACGGAGADELGSDFVALAIPERALRVMSAWQSDLPRLLVFDNCEQEELLDRWQPTAGGCRVLVTSRREAWSPSLGVNLVPLEVLSQQDSVALLRKYRSDLAEDDPTLEAITKELDRLPLALDLAGGYLANNRFDVSPEDYLAQLRNPDLLWPALRQVGGISPTRHELDVAKTFALSYERMESYPTDSRDEQDVKLLARKLLARAALFAPGVPIPRALLIETLELPEEPRAARLRARPAISELDGLGLLDEQENGDLRMHRLVAAFVCSVSGDTTAQSSVEMTLLNEFGQTVGAYSLLKAQTLEAHMRTVTDLAFQREDERVAALCTNLSRYLRMMGNYAEAKRYDERALAVREALVGENNPQIALELNDLGYTHYYLGDYATARSYMERALPLWEQRKDYPNLAATLDNLGQVVSGEGDYVGARAFYERALALREQVLGPTDPQTAITLNNLGSVMLAQGDLKRAREYYERALAIREQVFKDSNAHTAVSLQGMALLLQEQGDLTTAQEHLERALKICEHELGPNHYRTLNVVLHLHAVLLQQGDLVGAQAYQERAQVALERAHMGGSFSDAIWLNNVGYGLWLQGDYREAERYYKGALAIDERIGGKAHRSLSVPLNNLGMVLVPQGDYANARAYYERALAIRESSAGSEDLLTAKILNNLGVLLRLQGDLKGARARLEQAYAIRKQVLGEDHKDTATTINYLGVLLQAEGDFAGARHYIEHALSICEQVLGKDHPDVARSLNDLGVLLHAEGELVEARTRLQRALRIREKVLREGHQDTAQSLSNLASVLADQGNREEARPLFERAMAIYEEVLGEEHPITELVRRNLRNLDGA